MIYKTYVLSGLGADERVFSRVSLGPDVCFMSYPPHMAGERLSDYAMRMADQIDHPSPILVGLSFGGLLAQEIAARKPVERIILISSVGPAGSIPGYFRLAAAIGIPYLLPSFLLRHSNILLNWMFGLKDRRGKALLEAFMRRQHPSYLRWALSRIGRWSPPSVHCPVTHIHGSNDRILPPDNTVDHLVPGGHFMLYYYPLEVQHVLDRELGL